MFPILYEVNTRCWLSELAEAAGHPVKLDSVPTRCLAEWCRLGFTHIWLMGVWTSGPLARAQALTDPGQRRTYTEALPSWTEGDVVGSPYAVAQYQVPEALGGEAGLAAFRRRLHDCGLKLILDFVPNHLGLDHPWIHQRPELFVQSAQRAPETFLRPSPAGPIWLAHGKDPYFPAWSDTVQLDYRRPETRRAMTELLRSVAERCDGVRCDMAMLLLREVFERAWRAFPVAADRTRSAGFGPHLERGIGAQGKQKMAHPGSPLAGEFWSEAITDIKQAHPDFVFLAEAYWGLEPKLQALGFDYTYDKALTDKLLARNPPAVLQHLLEMSSQCLAAGAHFLENHDEPRIAARLSPGEYRAAVLLILALPGMRFLHDGQLSGARIKTPVQLVRRCPEPVNPEIQQFYEKLLTILPQTAVGKGSARLLEPRAASPGNDTARNFVLVQWQAHPPTFDVVVVNLAVQASQCYVPLVMPAFSGDSWSIRNLLGEEVYVRPDSNLRGAGLYLDVPPHTAQLFHVQPE